MIDKNDGLPVELPCIEEYIPNFVAIYHKEKDGSLLLWSVDNLGHRYNFANFLDDVQDTLDARNFLKSKNCFTIYLDPDDIAVRFTAEDDKKFFDNFHDFVYEYEYRA